MAFLTKSNSLRIIRNIDFERIGDLTGEVYKKPIYFFSNYEKNNLLGLKELLKDPIAFINDYYIPVDSEDKFIYVYEGGKPAYHTTTECSRLNANFRNFELPEEIKAAGKEDIYKFRNWFKENQYLLDTKKDLFAEKLRSTFGIIIDPKAIDYDNSGFEEKENLDLEQLEKRINQIISNAGQYYNNANNEKREIIRRFQKLTFLAYSTKKIHYNNTRFSDDTLKQFLKSYDIHFKKPIKDLLIEYYRVKYNPELKFEGFLLEELGFKKCGECEKKEVTELSSL